MLLLLLAACTSTVWSLSCLPCGNWPCETPSCCPSGEYTTDACGCCLQCASPKDEICGGPWGTSGTCATNLRCLRKCPCLAENGSPCVFPFTWKKNGKTYTACTKDESKNGQPWCATAVNNKGEALRRSLKDCQPGCPGSDSDIEESCLLFNHDGKCVSKSSAESLLRASVQAGQAAEIDEFYGDDSKGLEAPLCPATEDGRDGQKLCQCGPALPRLNGGTEGGCQEDSVKDYSYSGEEDKGWCFLDNVQDHENPSIDCYSDMEWSVSRGKFWSREACRAQGEGLEEIVIID